MEASRTLPKSKPTVTGSPWSSPGPLMPQLAYFTTVLILHSSMAACFLRETVNRELKLVVEN